MILQNLYHANLKIDAAGAISLESAWHLAWPEDAENPGSLLEKARSWAGNIGDPLRIPQPDGSFEFAETLRVTEITVKPAGLAACQVVFSGTESAPDGEFIATGEVSDSYDADGVRRRKRTFRATVASDSPLLPSPGRILDWEGGAFVCESCTRTASGLKVEFAVTARETSLTELGLHDRGIDGDGFETRSAVWFVAAAKYGEFTSSHPVGGAENWAGENFLLTGLTARPIGKIGYEITLHTRKAETRRLSQIRTEEFAGWTRNGATLREITWRARWRVVAEDLPRFLHLTGSAPEGWAEANCIITKITPAKLSEMEYDLQIEAQHRFNPGLANFYAEEDNSELDTRTDVSVDMVEFHISAGMAGYRVLPDGKALPIPNWNPSPHCPFQSSSRLAESMIERVLRCLLITVSVYAPGRSAAQIENLNEWAATRLFTSSVSGIPGSYLKVAQRCRETRDNNGKIYTRITRSYQKSPEGLLWNSNYWAGQ